MRSKRKVDIEVNEHKRKRRKNNPAVGLVNMKTEKLEVRKKKVHKHKQNISKPHDKHIHPELNWAGKKEHPSFEVPTVSLHTHEKIDPRAIIERVRKTNTVNYVQMSLFKDEQIIPEKYDIDFYKHDKNWSNRLIAGDSLLVMNSLLEKESMGGKVQCVYIDPPYGIKYGSNFQPFTNKRDVKDGKDEDLTEEPEMLKAFRDTWQLGIHSYLSYLRDRLRLAWELLADSGSCFVQISDENVHLVRCIMDEVFKRENFIRQISFVKTGSMAGNFLGRTSDHILWFAKQKDNEKTKEKYHQLYQQKTPDSFYSNVELPDGSVRKISGAEKADISCLPKGAKIFQLVSMESPGAASEDTPFEFEGKIFRPNKNRHWTVKYPDGMEAVKKSGRIVVQGSKLRWKYYLNDYPIKPIAEVWGDTSGFVSNQRYVVETRPKVIERCILMTTDPGDLVLDPTCGSGTTAYVAEQWGRRWITCDTSRVAITLAKQRLMTATYDYYKLENPYEGVGSGFQYEKVPHRTLGSIANNEPTKEETLYDQPLKDNKKKRVTAPFTVEAVPAHSVQSITHQTKTSSAYTRAYEWLNEVKRIKGKKGIATDMEFVRLGILKGHTHLHAEGETRNPRRVVISFGSEHTPLDKRQVEQALQEVKQLSVQPDLLVFAAFHFDAEASRLIEASNKVEKVKTTQVQINMDLQTGDLKKKVRNSESFWLIGQPDIDPPKKVSKDEYIVKVKGWDFYNPDSDKVESGGKNRIAMWILDTDYDGRAVFPKQVFFPMAGKNDGWAKLARTLKTEINEQAMEAYRSTESLPFKAGKNKKIAVKIIDDRGIESMKVIDLK